MNKKILTLLLALVMALSLVACSSQPTVSDGTTDDDSQLQQEVVEKDDTANTDTNNTTDTDHPTPPSDREDDVTADTGNNGDAAEPATSESDNISSDKDTATEDGKSSAGTTDQEHKHSYTTKVVVATCTTAGYTLHSCSCGDSYKDSTTKKLTHSYCEKVVAPTATAQGYTLHTCILCDDTYKDNYKPATGSNNNTPSVGGSTSSGNTGSTTPTTPTTPSTPAHKHNYTSTVVPGNCTTKGYTSYVCSCGDSYEDNYTGGNGHSWEAVYEEVPVYETVCITRCGHCHADITGFASSHAQEEALAGNGSRTYQSYEQVQVGTATEVVGYACSVCGTAK